MMTAEASTSQDERDGWIALNLVPDIGGAKLRAIKERFGSSLRALGHSAPVYDAIPGMGTETAKAAAKIILEQGRRERERAESLGIHILLWEEIGRAHV